MEQNVQIYKRIFRKPVYTQELMDIHRLNRVCGPGWSRGLDNHEVQDKNLRYIIFELCVLEGLKSAFVQ